MKQVICKFEVDLVPLLVDSLGGNDGGLELVSPRAGHGQSLELPLQLLLNAICEVARAAIIHDAHKRDVSAMLNAAVLRGLGEGYVEDPVIGLISSVTCLANVVIRLNESCHRL